MGKHTTEISLKLFDFLIDLGEIFGYHTETEYPMNANSFGGQAIDIAWFNEKSNRFPLFIFEIESKSNNSIANNPTKVFGKESRVFEKPLFFFHIIIDGAKNTEKYSDLFGLFGKYNYDIFKIDREGVEDLLLKIISQHRRIHDQVNTYHLIKLINQDDEIKSKITFERFLKNVENQIREDQLYRMGQVYVDVASRDKSFSEQYLKFIYRTFEEKRLSYLNYESYFSNITSAFINLGLLHSKYAENLKEVDFVVLLVEAQKTDTFSRIDYLPGLNYDYDVFIHDHVPFYIALAFFLFDGNVDAQRFMLDIAIKIIKKLEISEDFVFEHHLSWALLMSASNEAFFKNFEDLRMIINDQNGILDTILFNPILRNDHQELPDSKLIKVPSVPEYKKVLVFEFRHLNNFEEINEIAIRSLSEDWKDEFDHYLDLGIQLSNFAIKCLMQHR